MKHLILLVVAFTALACSQSDKGLSPNGLLGTWQLTSYCKPTGASTCTSVIVPSDKGVFISFDNTGRFNEFYENTRPIDYSFLGCGSGNYQLEGGSLRIRAGCMSSLNGQLVQLASIADNQLVLNPFGTGEYSFVRK